VSAGGGGPGNDSVAFGRNVEARKREDAIEEEEVLGEYSCSGFVDASSPAERTSGLVIYSGTLTKSCSSW
jgi:hypothetical protein